MAINATVLVENGTTSGGTSINTASITPTGNVLVIAEIQGIRGGGTAPPQPTLSGNGLTWVAINTRTWTDGATETGRITKFRAMGASPSAGAVTIAHGTAPDVMAWSIREYSDVDTGGTNGSAAVVQSAVNSGTGTTASVTLAAFGDATNNALDIGVATLSTPTLSMEAGITGFTQQNFFSAYRGGWRLGQDTSPSETLSASNAWGAIGIEIKAAAGGGGGSGRLVGGSLVRGTLGGLLAR